MWVTVVVPMTFPGSLISTLGSLAARANSASEAIPRPGAMTPPRYSPLAEMASKVIAVPKSTTTQGPPYLWKAATPLTMRSAPTSRGLSTSTAMPVLTPGSTNMARCPKYSRDISPSVQLIGGTTELTITPCTSRGSRPWSVNRFLVSTPYSSTVCMRAVVSRQCATSSSPRKTPRTVLVFPTSMVSSMAIRLLRLRHVPGEHRDQPAVLSLHLQQAFAGDPRGGTRKALPARGHAHLLAARVGGDRGEALGHEERSFAQKSIVIALKFAEQPRQQIQPGLALSAFRAQGGGG